MTLHHTSILVQSISVCHDNGEPLFNNISFSLGRQNTAGRAQWRRKVRVGRAVT